MLQEHQVVNQQKYKMGQDRWSAAVIGILFLFYNIFFSSSNLKMAIFFCSGVTDEKHGYSARRPPQSCFSWLLMSILLRALVQSRWTMELWVTIWMNFVNVSPVWMRWKYEWDLNTLSFVILHSCCSINALQQTSCSPKYLTSRAGPLLGGLCRLSDSLQAKGGSRTLASNLNLVTFLGFWFVSLSTNQNFCFLMWFFKFWTKKWMKP